MSNSSISLVREVRSKTSQSKKGGGLELVEDIVEGISREEWEQGAAEVEGAEAERSQIMASILSQ